MKRFIAEFSERRVRSPAHKAIGTAEFYTEISVKGNYRDGPVPVTIRYVLRFKPDEEYWTPDEEYPDEEPYSWNIVNDFDSPEEREFYFSSHYERIVEQRHGK